MYTLWDPILYAHWRHLICICWPEDGRNAVEICSQKLLNVLALTIVYFIILLLCLTWNIYTCIVTQRDGFRQAWVLVTSPEVVSAAFQIWQFFVRRFDSLWTVVFGCLVETYLQSIDTVYFFIFICRRFRISEMWPLALSCLSACLFVRVEHSDSHRTDFRGISHWEFWLKFSDTFRFSNKRKRRLTWRPVSVYELSSWLVVVIETPCCLWSMVGLKKQLSIQHDLL